MKHKAFTLIELLVVIVIIGILATVSTATYQSTIDQGRGAAKISMMETLADQIQLVIAESENNPFGAAASNESFVRRLGDRLEESNFSFSNSFKNENNCMGINLAGNYESFYLFSYEKSQPNNILVSGIPSVRETFQSSWSDGVGYSAVEEFDELYFNCVTDTTYFDEGSYSFSTDENSIGFALIRSNLDPNFGALINHWYFPIYADPGTGRICYENNGGDLVSYCTTQTFN